MLCLCLAAPGGVMSLANIAPLVTLANELILIGRDQIQPYVDVLLWVMITRGAGQVRRLPSAGRLPAPFGSRPVVNVANVCKRRGALVNFVKSSVTTLTASQSQHFRPNQRLSGSLSSNVCGGFPQCTGNQFWFLISRSYSTTSRMRKAMHKIWSYRADSDIV
eukprot:gene26378-17472_t